jgi:hypothetical protein
MRTIEVKLYQFNELSAEAKEKAIENLIDINVGHEWWEFTYEDAKQIGLKITGFDLDRNRHATGEFIDNAYDCEHAILKNHGKDCETYKTAQNYLNERAELEKQLEPEDEINPFYDSVAEIEDLDDEFLKSILEDYSQMLQNEYEYLMSEEAIIDTIEANEYEFTEDGELS